MKSENFFILICEYLASSPVSTPNLAGEHKSDGEHKSAHPISQEKISLMGIHQKTIHIHHHHCRQLAMVSPHDTNRQQT